MKRATVAGLNGIFGALALVWLLPAILSMTFFDRPGSEGNLFLVILVICIWAYPVFFVTGFVGSRAALKRRSARGYAVPLALLPGLDILLMIGTAILLWVACSGDFMC